ncbi:MAG: hypothetical protein ACFE9L_13175 [Candidatus Hodarchaeota archaeon]
MTSKKRDEYGRFTSENPKNILLRVTKAEKRLIDLQQLREFFSRDPYQFGSEDQTLNFARKVCSSFKAGEITSSEVLKVYFDVVKDFIESNLQKTRVLSIACLSSSFISETDLNKPLGYKLHLSYRLPWSGAYLRRNRSLRWDRTIRKIISYSSSKYIPIETYRLEVGRTRHLHITVDLALNFPR